MQSAKHNFKPTSINSISKGSFPRRPAAPARRTITLPPSHGFSTPSRKCYHFINISASTKSTNAFAILSSEARKGRNEQLAMQLLKATHPDDNDRCWRHDDDGREVNKRHIS